MKQYLIPPSYWVVQESSLFFISKRYLRISEVCSSIFRNALPEIASLHAEYGNRQTDTGGSEEAGDESGRVGQTPQCF